MTNEVTYTVRRAFRVPKNGGPHNPYRFYEFGVTITDEDIKIWGADADVRALEADGTLEAVAPPAAPAKPHEPPHPVEGEHS